MEVGGDSGLTPIGSEANHVLRVEKGFLSLGHEADGTTDPYDLGMSWIMSKTKQDFIGRKAIKIRRKNNHSRRELVGLLPEDPDILIDENAPITPGGESAPSEGMVTACVWSVVQKRVIALALLENGRQRMGESVFIRRQGHIVSATVTKPCFMIRQVNGCGVSMGYDVNIARLEVNAVIDMQGDPEAVSAWCRNALPEFPSAPNTSSTSGPLSLYWIAPGRWLLRADRHHEPDLLSITRPESAPVDISMVQVSDTLQFFSIIGREANDIISIACPLDHHDSAFPVNGVSYTDIFGVKGLLIRCEDGFEIAVERSFGDMIEDFLLRSCQ